MKVENITFVKYAELKDKSEYDYYLRYGTIKANDYFKLGDFTNQNFGFVKDMQDYLNNSGLTWQTFIEEISKKTKKTAKQIARTPLFFLQQARLYAKEQIEGINNIEVLALSYTATIEEESAGIDMFEKYRAFLQFDTLTGGDLTKLEQIKALPYTTCFTKLALEADRAIYETKINNIRNKRLAT